MGIYKNDKNYSFCCYYYREAIVVSSCLVKPPSKRNCRKAILHKIVTSVGFTVNADSFKPSIADHSKEIEQNCELLYADHYIVEYWP